MRRDSLIVFQLFCGMLVVTQFDVLTLLYVSKPYSRLVVITRTKKHRSCKRATVEAPSKVYLADRTKLSKIVLVMIMLVSV